MLARKGLVDVDHGDLRVIDDALQRLSVGKKQRRIQVRGQIESTGFTQSAKHSIHLFMCLRLPFHGTSALMSKQGSALPLLYENRSVVGFNIQHVLVRKLSGIDLATTPAAEE